MCAKTDEPKCSVCNDTGTVTAQDTDASGKVVPPIYEIPCPMPDDQHST
jgi:hypothetical protein